MIGCSSAVGGWCTVDKCNHSWAWHRRLKLKKLQDKGDQDQMHNNRDEETFEGHPISAEDYLRNDMLKAN